MASIDARRNLQRADAGVKPSTEMRRLTAGMRAATAMLCSILLVDASSGLSGAAVAGLLVYDLWAVAVLWSEINGRWLGRPLIHFWIDATWTGMMLQLVDPGEHVLIFIAVQPVVFAAVGYSVRHGMVLALYAALWILVPIARLYATQFGGSAVPGLSHALTALALVPGAALLAMPMGTLRRRLALARALEARLDARRGLGAVTTALVEGLRHDIGADLTGIVLPAAGDGPALLCTADDGVFPARPAVHAKLEGLLGSMPSCAVTHVSRHPLPWSRGTRLHGVGVGPASPELCAALDELCRLLEVRMLVVIPLQRYARSHGYLLVGRRSSWARDQEVQGLSDAAPVLIRIIEQAALVDRLVRETAAHERVRIGRDLHDSAIQPYLGIRYALEALARRVAPDNPARSEIEALTQLVEVEIDNLRDIVTGLRNGEPTGDNALLPAVRRQVRHFADLFGIDVTLDCPDQLPTSRALAGAVFYMVNEALNNVRRHTPAHAVHVNLHSREGWLHLDVRDDGGSVRGKAAPDFLPRSLSERVQGLGGTLVITRPDGLNTEIAITVPIDATIKS